METQSTFNVIVIPMLSDNLCYYIYGEDISKGSFVDVAEPQKITKFFKDFGINNEPVHQILTTHHHYDHAQGNIPCK